MKTHRRPQAASRSQPNRQLPIFQGLLPIDRSRLMGEVVAGITLAALGIPEVMGYAKLAGMPVVTGLYTLLLPMLVFAVFGSSRHLVVGADSATAVILAAGLLGMAPLGSSEYIQLASIVAVMAAGFLLLARLVRLGFLADFLSRSVLIGFLTGVGIQVAMGQAAGMLGVPGGTGGTLPKFFGTLEQIPQTSITTLVVSLSVLGVIIGLKALTKRIPGALIAVIGAIILSKALDLTSHGVSTLGKVPGGLPHVGFPNGWGRWSELLPTAGSIFLVILAQSAATSRAYAAKYREQFDENTDLVGLGLSNVAAGLSGTFVVNGSPTKTEMVDNAGSRSQAAQVATSAIILIVLLFLTRPLQYMPNAVLASIVFLIGIELVDLAGMRRVLRWRIDEFLVALITAIVVVAFGVEQGILLAIVLSVIDHLRRSYHPRNTVLVHSEDRHIRSVPMQTGRAIPEIEPGLVVYRFGASLYYANTNRFVGDIRDIMQAGPVPPAWLCLDASGIGDVDFSAGEALIDLHHEMHETGVRLVLAELQDNVRAELDRYGLTESLGPHAFFASVGAVVSAYRHRA